MKKNLEDIIAASICKFNVRIDIDGTLAPDIAEEICAEPCGYCRLAAKHICQQLEEGLDDGKQ